MVKSVKQITDDALHQYDNLEKNFVPSKDYIRNFGQPSDYIEAHVYTQNGVLIDSSYNVTDYRIPGENKAGVKALTDVIEFDPAGYIQNLGFTTGLFSIEYNLFRKKIFDSIEKPFFIKEISSDRKELRLSSNAISNTDLENSVIQYLYEFNSTPYYNDFLLNFGDNEQVNAINIALDKNTDVYSILIKLYEPLPATFTLLDNCWIVEELSASYTFEVELVPDIAAPQPKMLRPANFDVVVYEHKIKPTPYLNLDSIYNKGALAGYQRLLNRLQHESVRINVDYSDYSQFVHFSSAKDRLLNFAGKLVKIENYRSDINILTAIPQYANSLNVSSSIFTLQSQIDEIITHLDEYEAYLYFTSASVTWPRTGEELAATDSQEAIDWLGSDDYNSPHYGGQLLVAAEYDEQNQDNLKYSVPDFISEDGNNESYLQFISMTGQLFDSIWVCIKAIDDLYKANNSLYKGISKDIVYKSLQNLGIHLHECNDDVDLYQYYFGIRPQEDIDAETAADITYITNDAPATGEDAHKEIYKRVYHNLPALLKAKGTIAELKMLCAIYGIPDSVLDIAEFGGADKTQATIEYSYDHFTYALFNSSGSYIKIPWTPLSGRIITDELEVVPDAIELRFKPVAGKTYKPLTLLSNLNNTDTRPYFGINIIPTGSIYANVEFQLSGSGQYLSSSLTLPLYATGSEGDTHWYHLLLRRRNSLTNFEVGNENWYDLYVKNAIGGEIGYQASASLYVPGGTATNRSWMSYGTSVNTRNLYVGGVNRKLSGPFYSTGSFEGWLQEVRLWAEPLEEHAFDEHVLNPASYVGNTTGSAFYCLAGRFQLGSNLQVSDHSLTGSVASLHPNYRLPISSGSTLVNEFNTASFVNYPSGISYTAFNETVYANNANTVYANPVTDKIRLVDNHITGSILSPILKLEAYENYNITKDIHLLDASFSPQNEINKDIINHFGDTLNLDNVVGDPDTLYAPVYAALKVLASGYYQKFKGRYNYTDYIRTITFFNNSLFRLMKDNVPGRANLLTGITIKSTMLERNKIKSVSSSIDGNNLMQSSIQPVTGFMGDSTYVSNNGDGRDFFNGELSGSYIDYHDFFISGNINPFATFNQSSSAEFYHSDYNVLRNNVEDGITSHLYRRLNPHHHLISESVDLQDGYYWYARHANPRYNGSRSTSKEYNVYNEGDSSYGKNAAIDINVYKFAWIVEVNEKNLNFFDKASVYIKYLIDGTGSVTELSRQNKNLFEIQNIFKSGTPVGVSMTNVFSPSNQVSLDGTKMIWQGGFSYTPIVYREINETMYFQFVNPRISNAGAPGFKAIAGALEWKTLGNADADFANVSSNQVVFTIDGQAQSGIPFSFHSDFSLNWIYQSQLPITTGPYLLQNGDRFNDHPAGPETGVHYWTLDWFLPQYTTSDRGGYITDDFTNAFNVHDAGGEKWVQWTAPRTSGYTVNMNMPFQFYCNAMDDGWAAFMLHAVLEKKNGNSWNYVNKADMTIANQPIGDSVGIRIDYTHNGILWDNDANPNQDRLLKGSLDIKGFSLPNVQAGDTYRIRVYMVEIKNLFRRAVDIDFIIPANGFLEVFDYRTTTTNVITTGSITANPDFFTVESDYQTLTFNNDASSFYGTSYFVAPSAASSNGISEYYSPVEELFQFKVGDIIRFESYFSYNAQYYTIASIQKPVVVTANNSTFVITSLQIKLDRPLSKTVNAQSFAVLRQMENETSVILDFNKKNGQTSTGLLIPHNLEETIRENVSNIVAPLHTP